MIRAFLDGWSRVRRAPALVAGAWLATLAVAAPLALVLERQIANHLGGSLAAETALAGVNHDWWNEFLAQASGMSQTFVPAIIGFAAVLKNLSLVADAAPLPGALVLVLALQIGISMFLAGGILDRLARNRAIGLAAFAAACATYGARFLRLGLVAAIAYLALFRFVHPLLFDVLYPLLTEQVTVERTAFLYRALLYAVFLAAVLAVNLVVDYAKVRTVVEDRRSMIGALAASARFLGRHGLTAAGLYLLHMLLFLLLVGFYYLAAPGAASNLAAFVIGQLYIVLRVAVRLRFAASAIALFQSNLAHTGYAAAPLPVWPESPAAEALRP